MKNGTIAVIGIGALGLLAYKTWQTKKTVDMLQYAPAGISFGMSGISPVIKLKLSIYNPNQTAVPITDIVGSIIFKGNSIASFKNTAALKIDGTETRSVEINVRVNALATLQSLITKSTDKSLKVDGLIKTSVVDLPFSYVTDLNTGMSKPLSGIGSIKTIVRRKVGKVFNSKHDPMRKKIIKNNPYLQHFI